MVHAGGWPKFCKPPSTAVDNPMLEAKLKALRIAAEAGIADVTSRTKEFLHESGWMDDPAASPREPSPPQPHRRRIAARSRRRR